MPLLNRRHRSHGLHRAPERVIVTWQNPDDHRYHPVGELAHDDGNYSFHYLRRVAEAPDFRPLLGFPSLDQHYTSEHLFPLFAQRAMDPRRNDYTRYVSNLGLPADTTPWEQIARSGGRRQGDTIQLLPVPFDDHGHLRGTFLVHGIHRLPDRPITIGGVARTMSADQIESTLRLLSVGAPLRLISETENEYNPCALLVARDSHTPFGYVPDVLAREFSKIPRTNAVATAVLRVNGHNAPAHMRVLVEYSIATSDAPSFMQGEDWQLVD